MFLSFFIVKFYFMVKLFLKADRGILKQPPLFLTPLNPLKKRFKKLSLVSGVSSFMFILKGL